MNKNKKLLFCIRKIKLGSIKMYVFVYLFKYTFSCQIHTFLPQILTNVMHLDVSFDLLIFIRYLKISSTIISR